MPLISFWTSEPDAVGQLSVEQVVATAGDGNLKDGSLCSTELREYVRQIPTAKIASYIEHCLNTSFNRGGMVLQDLINELGRRLEYEVTNGRYQGISGAIGYDGLWVSPEGQAIVVEIKTTDAYRISLDTIARYRDQLISAGKIRATPSSVLIVVGRQDTGELEAQIRGSRHAWDVRLVSAEALIKLTQLKENSDSSETGRKIRSLLTPVEYTRVDRMVDIMFTTAADIESAASPRLEETSSATEPLGADEARPVESTDWQFTDSKLLQAKRDQIIAALSHRESTHLIRKSRALFWSAAKDVRAACAISKRYTGPNQNRYWYAFHPQWDEFLTEAQQSFFVLGCMDLDIAFAIPHRLLKPALLYLNTTTRDGGTYWHIHIRERDGELELVLPNTSERFPLGRFAVNLT